MGQAMKRISALWHTCELGWPTLLHSTSRHKDIKHRFFFPSYVDALRFADFMAHVVRDKFL